ncbi:MAG TPA: DUF2232 domain-containing protein [Beijerinckiaceae bacterium]|nr:DUF2232 domain-containing protein [Beijerinckiaceae bacterium]
MAQAILIGLIAGLASALLSGLLTPGSLLASLLFVIAPLPLMIVGLGWHPLVAALGALAGCLVMDLGLSNTAALYFGLLVGLPSYLFSELLLRLLAFLPALPPERAGRLGGTILLGSIGAYAVLVTLGGAMVIDTSHAGFVQRVARSVETLFRDIASGGNKLPLPGGAQDLAALARLYAQMLPPMLAFIIAVMLSLSLWLGLKVARTSQRIAYPVLPAHALSLPSAALFVFIGGFGLAQLGGYIGLFGTLVMVAVTFALILNGLAVLHARTLGSPSRALILSGVWGAVLVFGIPAFALALVGAVDCAFGLRNTRNKPLV